MYFCTSHTHRSLDIFVILPALEFLSNHLSQPQRHTMVLVEEVPDASASAVPLPTDDLLSGEHESDFETSSSFSDSLSDDDFDPSSETIYDRLVALRDIVPPSARLSAYASYEKTKSWVWWSVFGAGNLAWIVGTSAILMGLPLALAIEDETRIVQQEREMQMQTAGQQQVSAWLFDPDFV